MGVWREQVVPRLTEVMLGNSEVRGHRRQVVTGLKGSVVEIGFGSGLNVPLYPVEVESVYAVDPSALAQRLAAAQRLVEGSETVQALGLPVRRCGHQGGRTR
jgi:hypothetical protein